MTYMKMKTTTIYKVLIGSLLSPVEKKEFTNELMDLMRLHGNDHPTLIKEFDKYKVTFINGHLRAINESLKSIRIWVMIIGLIFIIGGVIAVSFFSVRRKRKKISKSWMSSIPRSQLPLNHKRRRRI